LINSQRETRVLRLTSELFCHNMSRRHALRPSDIPEYSD